VPSSKAMENKTLTATCANPTCGTRASTELMVSVRVGRPGYRRQVTMCAACAEKGWQPPQPEDAGPR